MHFLLSILDLMSPGNSLTNVPDAEVTEVANGVSHLTLERIRLVTIFECEYKVNTPIFEGLNIAA